MSIGNEIRRLRKGKGLTLQDLAGKLEISVSYLSQVEKNEKAPNEKIYKGMFKVFGVHLAELEGGEGEALAHIAVNGLSGVKVEALRGLAEKFKEAGDTEFYELMANCLFGSFIYSPPFHIPLLSKVGILVLQG
jgi:transcriptional regulator with XRE-family HTH domain